MFSSLKSILMKLRMWGINGVIDWALRLRRQNNEVKVFLQTMFRPGYCPERGITIIADMTRTNSLSKVMRDFAFQLRDAGIPFQVFNSSAISEIPDEDFNGIITKKEEFWINRYSHIVEMNDSPLLHKAGFRTHRVAFWEFESGFLESRPGMMQSKSVIAMSDFNWRYFRSIYPSDTVVSKILYPFRFEYKSIEMSRETIRKKFEIPQSAFMVFFNFDLRSSYYRKNPEALIHAFAIAFRNANTVEPKPILVLKVIGADEKKMHYEKLKTVVRDSQVEEYVKIISGYISQQDIYALTNACDVYCSLHRGEGLGLGIAEAMSMGKPVVVANYSAPLEFCNESNSILVPVKIIPAKNELKDHALYKWVKEWAEPDFERAAQALNRLYRDVALRQELGARAKASICSHFSLENF